MFTFKGTTMSKIWIAWTHFSPFVIAQGLCRFDWTPLTQTIIFKFLSVIDMSEMDRLPGITLHAYQTNLYTNGKELRLSRSRIFTHYSFSGITGRNWSVYEKALDAEKNRFPLCVFHDGNNRTRPYPEPIEFAFEYPIHITGVKEGCAGDPVPNTELAQFQNSDGLCNAVASFPIMTFVLTLLIIIQW